MGAGGHGKVVADIAKRVGYTEILFLDDNPSMKTCNGYLVVGTGKDYDQFHDSDFIVAIGNSKIRKSFQDNLSQKGLSLATLVHPNAVIGENVVLGEGTVVMAGAVINPCVKIGRGCIINTCASVDHDCVVGEYAHISIGAHIAGAVTIGNDTWIGVGAAIINNVEICNDCMVGAGATVISSLCSPGTYIGAPAKRYEKDC